MTIFIKRNSHVKYDIGVSNLIDDFNLLNKVGDALFLCALPAKSFNGDGSAHPLGPEDFAVATTSEKVRFVIVLKVGDIDVKVEAIFIECLMQESVLTVPEVRATQIGSRLFLDLGVEQPIDEIPGQLDLFGA